jgi:hypothetical protein
MRKYWTTFFGIPRLGMGAALLALFAFTVTSRASVTIVSDLTAVPNGDLPVNPPSSYKSEGFSVFSGFGGKISSVTLYLNFNTVGSTLNVSLYSANLSGVPGSGALIPLGTITSAYSSGDHPYTLSGAGLANYSLTAGNYAVVINESLGGSATVLWELAKGPYNTGTGGVFLPEYYSDN